MTEGLKQKLREWLHERQKQLLKEDGNVAIRMGKYDMIREVLAVLDEEKKPKKIDVAEEMDKMERREETRV